MDSLILNTVKCIRYLNILTATKWANIKYVSIEKYLQVVQVRQALQFGTRVIITESINTVSKLDLQKILL